MKNWLKKASAILLAVTLLAGFLPASAQASSPLFTIEAEDATLTSDLHVATEIYGQPKPGFTGSGFVWMQGSGTISFNVTAPETGMYTISTRYMQELSPDGRQQHLAINGLTKNTFMLPYSTTWSTYNLGYQKLNKGINKIELKSGWGYAYFDSFTIDVADLDPLIVEPTLIDPQATPETQILMNYLTEVYGKKIISGQQEVYGDGNDGDSELEFEWIYNLSGKYPAIRGFDFMNYNPLYGWEDGTTERMIDWVNNRGGIATASWHINVPRDFTAYTPGEFVDWKEVTYKPTETNFDTKKVLIAGTKENQYVQEAIGDMAEQLLILQENNVPVLFRPYHEAEGNGGLNGEGAWFWWGAGGAETYKQLWDMLYTELTETYGLHNLIWTYNSYTYSTSPAWYPGDDMVDLVGYDKYNVIYNRTDGLSGVPNEDAITSIFYQLVDLTNGKKMVAMTENDTIPSLQNLTEEKAGWLYFCPWYGEHLMSTTYNYPATIKTLYQSDYVITLDELPNLKVTNPTPNSSITPTSIEFDKHNVNETDKSVSVNFNGNSLTALRSGSTVLTENVDYTVTTNSVVLKKIFLSQLSLGEHTIIFDFNNGKDAVLKVTVIDSNTPQPQPDATITPTTATFDKAANVGQDVSVAVTLNGHELTSLTRGTTALVAGQDYTASTHSVVLSKAYLATLPVGQSQITFNFNSGNAAVLTLTVVDSTVVVPAGDVVIQSFNGNTSSSTSGIAPKFKIVNHGNSVIDLSDVTLRYYYTIDGENAQTFWSDWTSIGSENVTSKFVKMTAPTATADYYLEVGFTSAAGSLQPGQSVDIQGRFSKNNWSSYDQSNDYSFKALGNQFADNDHVTGYLNDQLVWGIEP